MVFHSIFGNFLLWMNIKDKMPTRKISRSIHKPMFANEQMSFSYSILRAPWTRQHPTLPRSNYETAQDADIVWIRELRIHAVGFAVITVDTAGC